MYLLYPHSQLVICGSFGFHNSIHSTEQQRAETEARDVLLLPFFPGAADETGGSYYHNRIKELALLLAD